MVCILIFKDSRFEVLILKEKEYMALTHYISQNRKMAKKDRSI